MNTYFRMDEPPEFVGPLAPNELLQKSRRIFENKVRGAESMVVDGGNRFGQSHINIGEISKNIFLVINTSYLPFFGLPETHKDYMYILTTCCYFNFFYIKTSIYKENKHLTNIQLF